MRSQLRLRAFAIGVLLLLPEIIPAWAQQSASYMIKGAVLNSGGHPLQGSTPSSPRFALRPDALGEAAVAANLGSSSFKLSAGFVQSFPTPGEVNPLTFDDPVTLSWHPEPLAEQYHVYRAGPMGSPTGVGPVADCLHDSVTGEAASDTAVPPVGQAFFYFVNAVSCIGVEGPDGVIGVPCT